MRFVKHSYVILIGFCGIPFAPSRAIAEASRIRQIRSDADEKALGVLTAEQKQSFEEMQGEKFELEMRRGRQLDS